MNNPENGHSTKEVLLKKRLRMERDDRFEILWNALARRDLIEDWELGRLDVDEVVEFAKEYLSDFRAWSGQTFSTRQKQESQTLRDIPVEPVESEKDIPEAFRKYLAAHAAKRPLVQRFRREALPHGRLLKRDEEIVEFLFGEEFAYGELVGELNVESYVDDFPEGESGGGTPLILESKSFHRDTCGVYTDEELADMRALEDQRQEREIEWDWDWYEYTGELLQTLAKWLVGTYPWGSIMDAELFLIYGRPPRLVEPLRAAQDMELATYSITFSSWVSEESVLRAYRTIQLAHRRPPGDKTIRILHFVSGQADDEGVLPSWAALYERWNAANPDERFSDRSALHKAYRRAVEALVPPYLPLT
jgi:hypothetical protein